MTAGWLRTNSHGFWIRMTSGRVMTWRRVSDKLTRPAYKETSAPALPYSPTPYSLRPAPHLFGVFPERRRQRVPAVRAHLQHLELAVVRVPHPLELLHAPVEPPH